MKLINSPYKIECFCCHKFKNQFVVDNKHLICLDCKNKKFQKLKTRPKLTTVQLQSIRKNLKDFEANRPKVKILYGGCFN